MFEMMFVGVVTAIAVIVVMAKLNIRRFLWCEAVVDVAFTIALMIMFAGTLGGMIAAVVGGLVLSIALWLLKKQMGYERLVFRRWLPRWERRRGGQA